MRIAFRDSLGIPRIVQANSYGIFGEDLPTLSYLKPTWKADNFKFTGKENLEGTGFIDFAARWYDNIVPRFTTVDPLSELSRRFSPFTYGNNNPILMIDPDGMKSVNSIQKAWDNTAEGSSSSWTNNDNGGFSNDPPTAANVNTADSYDKLGTGTNITSGIYSGTKLAEVTVKGRRPDAFDESIRTYGSGSYNRRYYPRNPNDANNYSPYNPKAVGFSYRFGGGAFIPGGGLEVGMAFGSGEIAFFASPTVTAGINYPGLNTGFSGLGGLSFNMYDTYGAKNLNVYDGMRGNSLGTEVNAIFGGGYSESAYILNGQVKLSNVGTSTTSISFPTLTNWGYSRTLSNTHIWHSGQK